MHRSYIGTDLQPLDTENLFLFNEGSFNGLQAYKNSKAANIMFAYELARKLSGSGVKVNAVCPGKCCRTDAHTRGILCVSEH